MFFFLIVFKGCYLNIKRPWIEISRIRRQSQNFIIYFILPKRPFWWTFFKNRIKKFHRALLSPENPIVQTTPRRPPTTLTSFPYYRLKNSNVSSHYEIETHENPVKFFMINSHVLMVNFHGFSRKNTWTWLWHENLMKFLMVFLAASPFVATPLPNLTRLVQWLRGQISLD